jgi:pimeloyl-ACP methyl ester carboxylesterase
MVALPSGLRLHVASAGQGPVVLLIHGFPQTWHCWRHVIDLLAVDHLVIAPDYRGAGLSDRPLDGYDKATMARDLIEVVEKVAGTTVEHVIGHDIGAMVATSLAMQQPELRSLTLVDAPIPGTDTWDRIAANPRVWHLAFHANVDLAERLVTGNEQAYIDEFIRVRIGNPAAISSDSVREYVEAYRRPGALRAAFSAYAAIPLDAQQNRAVLKEPLAVPTLTVGGTLSTSGPLMAAAGAEVSTNTRNVTIDGAGHWIPEEAPVELVDAWRTWQDDLRTTGR